MSAHLPQFLRDEADGIYPDATGLHRRTALNAAADRIETLEATLAAVRGLHKRSSLPASRGEHKGRYFCSQCTSSVDDFTLYVDWPCATAQAMGD